MSDLIDRQNAIDVLEILADKMSDEGQTVMAQAVAVLKDLRSEEPERTAKVIYRSTTMGLSFCCGNCGKPVHSEGKYCHHCGARLEWE